MKYRLTVKGQVALAALVLLIVAGSTFWKPNRPIEAGTPDTASVPPAAEAPAASTAPPTPLNESETVLSAQDLEQLLASGCAVYFGADQWEIRGSEIGKLTAFVERMQQYPNQKVVIAGHIHGPSGTESDFGQQLSMKRAQVVAQVLIGKGIDSSRLIIRSNGSGNPATEDPEKAWLNRRTEVYFEAAGMTPTAP